MTRRIRCRGVLAAVVGLLCAPAGPEVVGSQAAAQDLEDGSNVPCAVPLAWRVTRVDDEFGIDLEAATAAVGAAARLWEDAARIDLFEHDPDDGFPIRLVYDERQARTDARLRRREALDAEAGRLDAEHEALARREDAIARAQAAYEARAHEHARRVAEHNESVRQWNERGGAPADVGRELDARARALEAEQQTLEREASALMRELDGLQADEEVYNRSVTDHWSRAEALRRAFPATAVQSGEYREMVERENDRLVSVHREIRIYRFSDDEELRLVAAHELGHALGLGHSTLADAVMSVEHTRISGSDVPTSVHADDLERLRATCPALFGGR